MSDNHPPIHDLLSLTILALLVEKPRHPYEMQRLIQERRKEFAKGNPRGLYHAVDRLQKQGFIELEETSRAGNRPERTIYRLTEEGREEFIHWLTDLLSTPQSEHPAFTAAVSFMGHLSPEECMKALLTRTAMLGGELGALEAYLSALEPQLHRVLFLELEYTRAVCQAELKWVQSLIEEIRSGKLTWENHWENR